MSSSGWTEPIRSFTVAGLGQAATSKVVGGGRANASTHITVGISLSLLSLWFRRSLSTITDMNPLSISASIVGILTAAAQVGALLGQIRDAPESVTAIVTEIEKVRLVFRALQWFIDNTRTVDSQRTALIPVEDLTEILTQTVLVFSELKTLMGPLSADGGQPSVIWRVRWCLKESGIKRLVDQLQRHKTSLSLLLQVTQWYARFRLRDIGDGS